MLVLAITVGTMTACTDDTFIETTESTTAEVTEATTQAPTTTGETTTITTAGTVVTTTEDTVVTTTETVTTSVSTITTTQGTNTGTTTTTESTTAATTVPAAETYIFEAEYTYLDELIGYGFSGSVFGAEMVDEDVKGGGASNDYYVTYLYGVNITLTFEITSDRAVSNAVLYMRLSAEVMDITISPSNYTVLVNGAAMQYNSIVFTDVPGVAEPTMYPFEDYLVGTISLVEGVNTIQLITTNTDAMAGTMYATAPIVDCIKIETTAVLTWVPLTDNI